MIDASAYAALKTGGKLPSPSGTTLALIEKLKRDDVGLQEICALIQSDPALTGRILKLANSAAYARARPVAAITPEVLMLLGLPAIRNLALAFSLIDAHRAATGHFDFARYWLCALAEASAAQVIGASLRLAPAAELFALGLLADIGQLALACHDPAGYDRILARLGVDASAERYCAEETALFGFDHAELTALMLADWGLPRMFCDAARWHGLPESLSPLDVASRPGRLGAALTLAHALARCFLLDDATARLSAFQGLKPRADHLGLSDFLQTADIALTAWREWGEALAMPTPLLVPFALLEERPLESGEPIKVLVVEDDAPTRRLLEAIMQREGYEVRMAADGAAGVALALGWAPEIVVTDILMPGMDGVEMIRTLRARAEGKYPYVVVVSVIDALDRLTEAFQLGADDYVIKPIDARLLTARLLAGVRYVRLKQELLARNIELAAALKRAEDAALSDALTGLANRRHAMQRLKQECSAAMRTERNLSVLMIDIDHFKRVNDDHGHNAGDAVLTEVARRLQESARISDVVCRFGGEEFLVLAVDTPLSAAQRLAERMRAALAATPVALPDGGALAITASFGVAGLDNECSDVDKLVMRADEALYAAKAAGRNRVATAA